MNEDREAFNAEVEQLVLNLSHALHDKELSTCMAALAAVLVTVTKQLPINNDEPNTFIDPRESCMLAVLSAAWESNVLEAPSNLQ